MMIELCFSLLVSCRRFQIRGAKRVIFYSLPEYPHFYSEIVNNMAVRDHSSNDQKQSLIANAIEEELSVTSIFSTYEMIAIERIVGQKRCQYMISADKTSFLFK
jgi:U3 small nucleolar RNA-associated protein 25